MREIGHLDKHPELRNLEKLKKSDKYAGQKIEKVDLDSKHKYTIDDILDKVEEGDVSILVELDISYTEIATETGNKKISFNYEGTRYTVNIINNTDANNEVGQSASNNIQIDKNDDGSFVVYEYSADGTSLLKSTEYDKYGNLTTVNEFNDNGYKIYYYRNGVKTTEVNIDKQGRPYHQFDYDNSGNVIRIWELAWNEDGSSIVTGKTSDGKMISLDKSDSQHRGIYAERYENGKLQEIIETDYLEDGVSRQIYKDSHREITRIIYWAENGAGADVIKGVYKENKNFLKELKNLAQEYQKQLDDISIQIRSLDVPTPPNAMDYKKLSDGSIDENAYNNAMQQYHEQMISYHNKMDELGKKSIEIQNKLEQVNMQVTKLEFETKFERIENTLNSLKNTSNTNNQFISILELTLGNIKQSISDLPNKKLELQNKIQNIYSQVLNMQVPIPPSASDFKKTNDSIDEEAYEAAFNKYENEKYQYDRKINQLEAEAADLHNEIAKIDIEIQKRTRELNQLEKNVNTIKRIQDIIDRIKDKENNKDSISKLNKMLENSYNNIITQNEIRQKMDILYDKLLNESIPTPPSTNDYKNQDGSVDEIGYSQAFTEYEDAKDEYDKITTNINKQLDIFSEELTTLDNTLTEIQKNILKLKKH